MIKYFLYFLLSIQLISFADSSDIGTKFLNPGKVIFEADFDDGKNPGKPLWQLRKSKWVVEDKVLTGVNIDGNGPFIRLHSKEKGGILPENYIMKFSFKTGINPDVESKKARHPKYSFGHRFSYGHYHAKYQWRMDQGMVINMGHATAIIDPTFFIERDKWYHVTTEIRDDEILMSIENGPTYFLKDDSIRHKPAGFEFFTHITEKGYFDNLKIWDLAEGTQEGWEELRQQLVTKKLAVLVKPESEKKKK